MRGATPVDDRADRLVDISIHAPLAGSDSSLSYLVRSLAFQSTLPLRGATEMMFAPGRSLGFQSTLPLRGATEMMFAPGRSLGFQSTLPLRGATTHDHNIPRRNAISIHAPLAGSDQTPETQAQSVTNFNPRSPCGERPTPKGIPTRPHTFQSTLPLRGATRR